MTFRISWRSTRETIYPCKGTVTIVSGIVIPQIGNNLSLQGDGNDWCQESLPDTRGNNLSLQGDGNTSIGTALAQGLETIYPCKGTVTIPTGVLDLLLEKQFIPARGR